MTVWGLNSLYQTQFQPTLFGGFGYNAMPFGGLNFGSSIFGGISSFPQMNMFGNTNNNIFASVPPFNFGHIPQLNLIPTETKTNLFDFLNVTKRTNPTVSTWASSNTNINTNLPELNNAEYNKDKASKLSVEISKIAREGGFDNLCAKRVKDAINKAGLGAYKSGHAYQMSGILEKNNNFKEIKAKGIDLSKLPAGCVLVYDKGIAGYSSKYGHTEITLGNGTAGSGGITHNIRDGARVFIPV